MSFVRKLAVFLLLAFLCNDGGAAGDKRKKVETLPYIDAHVHVWTSDTVKYPLAPGYKKENIRPVSFTPEELFKLCKPAGVGRIALIQISTYGFDNTYMLDMIAKYPDVFVGTALIDPYNEPERVMDRMARQGVRAFRILPKLSKEPIDRWLRPDGFAKMFAAGARNNQAISCLIDPDALPEVDRMCTAYPETPVIIDHLARIGVDGVIRDRTSMPCAPWPGTRRSWSRSAPFTPWARRRPPTPTWDR